MVNTHNHTGTIACVVDTECTYISKNPRMVFHFGATIGDIEQENSFRVIKMDYYVKEVMQDIDCLLYTSPSPRDKRQSRMPSSA